MTQPVTDPVTMRSAFTLVNRLVREWNSGDLLHATEFGIVRAGRQASAA